MKFTTFFLTCADQDEADKIADALLDSNLAACVKQTSLKSKFHWDGKIQTSNEILLVIESAEEVFDDIEQLVTKLHSYDEYVLTATPIKTTPGVESWISDALLKR